MVNRIWPTAVAGEADSVSSVSASACHISGPNFVNPGQIMIDFGKFFRVTWSVIRNNGQWTTGHCLKSALKQKINSSQALVCLVPNGKVYGKSNILGLRG